MVSSALVVMAIGVVKRWKYPIGYYLSTTTIKSTFVEKIIKHAIRQLDLKGFIVLGITSDQGSNFERALKLLGSSPTDPTIKINNSKYFVHRDAPHLLKNARNYLLRGNVTVLSFSAKASFHHLKDLYELDLKSSFKMVPKLTKQHVYDLQYANKMKVKLAAQTLSNSCAAALNFCVANNKLQSSAAATAEYCKRFNDILDALNSSSPRDTVTLRRPLSSGSLVEKHLQGALIWLEELKVLNADRRKCPFIDGFIQSITATLQLNNILERDGIHYLSTRNFCQDPLELFFGKIRLKNKFPDTKGFIDAYAKAASASLVRALLGGNCE